MVGRRAAHGADPGRALRPRAFVPGLRAVAILPAARYGGARQRRARHLSRLRRPTAARPRAAVARAPAGDVPAVSPRLAALRSLLRCKTPTGRPAGRPVNSKPDLHSLGLFLVHHLLQLLAGAERGCDRRLDLNRTARLGIAAHARRPLAGLEIPEAGDLDLRA